MKCYASSIGDVHVCHLFKFKTKEALSIAVNRHTHCVSPIVDVQVMHVTSIYTCPATMCMLNALFESFLFCGWTRGITAEAIKLHTLN